MYRTYVHPDLAILDEALLRLRRLWSPDRARVIDDAGMPVEMSSLLVVEACARRGADAEVAIGDVAEFADVAHSTASRLVDRAEQAGLVTRHPSVADSRRTAVTLTAQGRALQARAHRARTAWLAGRVRDWPEPDVRLLGDLLTRFAAEVDRDRADTPSRYGSRPAPGD